MSIGERIRQLRKERRMTLEQVGDIVGVGKSTVRKWESGQIANMRRDKIALLAKALQTTPGYLMGWDDDLPAGFAMPENLIPVDRLALRRVPVLGDTAAGQPIIANRAYDEFIWTPDGGPKYDAALRVVGDSMEPRFCVGDYALIRYQDDVEDGQIAAVCLDDEITLKRVYHIPNGLQLVSDNPKYAPLIVTSEDIGSAHLVGLAVGLLHWEI